MKKLGLYLMLIILLLGFGSLAFSWVEKGVDKVSSYLGPKVVENAEKQAANVSLSLQVSSTSVSQIKEVNDEALRLRFVGDIMLDRGVKQVAILHKAGNYDFAFEKIPTLKDGADVLFGNLEGPISIRGTHRGSIYSFRMDPAVAPALKKAGFDVVSVANNHAGDWDKEAFVDTLTYLKKSGILYTGGGRNWSEAASTTIIQAEGKTVGFLGFSDVGPNWMASGAKTPGVLIVDARMSGVIAKASKQVDFLVVSFHFGEEYMSDSNQRQQTLARLAVESGADLVIGHHPHVVQETEDYNGGFIAYSLGNFIFDQYFSLDTMEGMVLDVELGEDAKIKEVKKNLVKLNKFFQPAWATK